MAATWGHYHRLSDLDEKGLYSVKNLLCYDKHNYTIFSVDKLIQNLGDPRVAEKLRIYRLVEEQFALVESQVQKEVYFRIILTLCGTSYTVHT